MGGLFALLGMGSFVVVSLAVGLRLLARWSRDGDVPELAIGAALLSIGPLGYIPAAGGLALLDSGRIEGAALLGWGNLMLSTGALCAAWFAVHVFRPASGPARASAAALAGGLLAAWGAVALTCGYDYRAGIPAAADVANVLRALALGWAAAEALRYWRALRRRAALGLADPVATASVGLWGLGIGAGALTFLLTLVGLHAGPRNQVPDAVSVAMSALGLVSAVCFWLAFMPPERLRRRLERPA